ncbi:NADH-dependent flavin reductase subunit 1 [Neolewinella maritima]|uniref:NADH-dependent flavin reductase subunit 1 n=1 Tax=Neolewinella maritima TaxID=1383882 RepID=A0ABN8F699_9BACT|nr:NADPH-dependent FMN reductase [Neolewinella maritima]CAH1002472.1 NADH-dependent flavin reductase subunit 1 [Neolewinella maritima]
MRYLTLSGSPAPDSANSRFLAALAALTEHTVQPAPNPADLPVFQPARDRAPWPASVLSFRAAVADASAVIISTPAYLHNMPAVLKNALEWLTSSGEFHEKPTLVFTLTPHAPRGERARQSLLWSLEALNARVVAETGLYRADLTYAEDGTLLPGPTHELLTEALKLLHP